MTEIVIVFILLTYVCYKIGYQSGYGAGLKYSNKSLETILKQGNDNNANY